MQNTSAVIQPVGVLSNSFLKRAMINNRMHQINENTFCIGPKFVVKDSTQIFWVELKCPIPLFYIDTYRTPNGRITAEGFCIELKPASLSNWHLLSWQMLKKLCKCEMPQSTNKPNQMASTHAAEATMIQFANTSFYPTCIIKMNNKSMEFKPLF